MNEWLNQIVQGDCLEVMKELPDESVDLVVTSPPYNIGNSQHTGSKRHFAYNDNLPEEKYQQWQLEILQEFYRILKPDGSVMYNHKNRIKEGRQITPYEWLLKSPLIIKQEIVWVNRSQNFDKCRLYPWTERIYWLAKSATTKMFNNLNHNDVFDYREWKPTGTKGEHTRAYPEEMAGDLIGLFPDAKIILDPFIGSGTTAVAALNTGRFFVGIEKEPKYVEIACKRVKAAQAQLSLFG